MKIKQRFQDHSLYFNVSQTNFWKFAKIKIIEILFIDKRQNLDFIFNLIFI